MVWSAVLQEFGAICDPEDYDGGEDTAPHNYDPKSMDQVEKETIARLRIPLMHDHAKAIPIPDIHIATEILVSKSGFIKHVAHQDYLILIRPLHLRHAQEELRQMNVIRLPQSVIDVSLWTPFSRGTNGPSEASCPFTGVLWTELPVDTGEQCVQLLQK